MKVYSKKEHLMVFRRSYKGPLNFEKGDQMWSKIRSTQKNNTECFIFVLNKYHPDFDRLAHDYKLMYEEEWDGSFVIPCGYVQFSENELEAKLRPQWEETKQKWKKFQEEQNHDC